LICSKILFKINNNAKMQANFPLICTQNLIFKVKGKEWNVNENESGPLKILSSIKH
jgi:hypothetical protein